MKSKSGHRVPSKDVHRLHPPPSPFSEPVHDALARAARTFMVSKYAPSHILVDRALNVQHVSSSGNLHLGLTIGESLESLTIVTDGGLRAALRLIAEAAMRDGKPVLLDDIALGKGEGARRLTLSAEPVSAGAEEGCLIFFADAEVRSGTIREGEIDQFLSFLLEDAGVAVVILDGTLKVLSFTPRMREVAGIGDIARGAAAADVLGDLLDATIERDLARVLESGRMIERTLGSTISGARQIKLMPVPAFFTGQPGEGVAIVFQRAMDRRMSDGGGQDYAEDLNHRLKNILGNAIAMASLMLEGRPTTEDFRDAFVGRIQALADANNLVARSNWAGTEIRSVILQELESVAHRAKTRIRVEGPVLLLRPRCAVTLGMAMHEMAINAVQHGAFAHFGMSLDVSWRIATKEGAMMLAVDWIEGGGTGFRVPERKGFGGILIEQGIAHELSGHVEVEHADEGIRYRIEVPVSEALVDSAEVL